jgi:hypothetical protein
MRKTRVLVLAVAALSLIAMLFTGCTTTKSNYSGWMKDYSKLQPDREFEGSQVYVESNDVLRKYTKFIVDPVSLYISPDVEIRDATEKIDPKTVHEITTYFRAALIKAIEKDFQVVDKPDQNVARIRAAITGVQLTKKALKPRNFIPIALVITAAGEATGLRDKLTVVNMEGEVLDSLTGRRVAAVVQTASHEVSVQKPEDLKGKDAYPTLDFWAEKVRKRLNRVHGS